MRQPLRYFGGKASVADWIVSHLPPHGSYIEPFGGGAAVLLRKDRSRLETYNDLARDVVTFFKVMRDKPDELVRAIKLTPFSRDECGRAMALLQRPGRGGRPSDVERARLLYVVSWQSIHGAPPQGKNGWRPDTDPVGSDNARQFADVAGLEALTERLRGVQIECRDALRVIARYDRADALHYVDPPYLEGVRGRRWAKRAYTHELSTEAGHRTLAELLRSAAGAVVLSGYDHPLYTSLYGEWFSVSRWALSQQRQRRKEVLWLNDRAADAVRQRPLPFAEDVDVAYSHGVA